MSEAGLTPGEVRRAWAALGQGAWRSERLLRQWERVVEREGRWRVAEHGGYRPVAVDVTGFWRPRLRGCPTQHYHAAAGRALPAIVLGLVVRVGAVAGQRLGLPVAFVRADPADPGPRALLRQLVRTATALLADDEVLIADREFGVALLQEERVPRFLVRLPKDFTARRASPPPYRGRGRPPTRGELVRPLARQRRGRTYPATPPDEIASGARGGGRSGPRSGGTSSCPTRRPAARPSGCSRSTIPAISSPSCWPPRSRSPRTPPAPSTASAGPPSTCPSPPSR